MASGVLTLPHDGQILGESIEAFIIKCREVFLASGEKFPDSLEMAIERLIQSGTSRMVVFNQLSKLYGNYNQINFDTLILDTLSQRSSGVICEDFILQDKNSISDRMSFLYRQVLGRELTHFERLKADFVYLDSPEVWENIFLDLSIKAKAIGRKFERISLNQMKEVPAYDKPETLIRGNTFSNDGKPLINIIQLIEKDRYVIGENVELKVSKSENGRIFYSRSDLLIKESKVSQIGPFLEGPGKNLDSGKWILDVDIMQEPDVCLELEVSANSGLSELTALTFFGDLEGKFIFEVRPEHLMVSVRLKPVEMKLSSNWISFKRLNLTRLEG